MRGSAPLQDAGPSPLIAIAMDIGPQPRSPPNYTANAVVPSGQRDTPRAACAFGGLTVELQIFGQYTADPRCQCHQCGRHKLMLLRACGLERLAAVRPGCGFNSSDVSKLGGRRPPQRTRSTPRCQSASNASFG